MYTPPTELLFDGANLQKRRQASRYKKARVRSAVPHAALVSLGTPHGGEAVALSGRAEGNSFQLGAGSSGQLDHQQGQEEPNSWLQTDTTSTGRHRTTNAYACPVTTMMRSRLGPGARPLSDAACACFALSARGRFVPPALSTPRAVSSSPCPSGPSEHTPFSCLSYDTRGQQAGAYSVENGCGSVSL